MSLPGLSELARGVFVYELHGAFVVNAGIVVGDDAVAIIDTGTMESEAREILAAVASVTDKPVRYVINTHHHGDHSFGNWWFLPAIVIGQRASRVRLVGEAGESHRDLTARLVPAAAEQIQAVPVVPPALTFEQQCRLQLGEHSLRLDFFGRAHTDNDIAIGVEGQDVNFAGDLIEESGPPVAFEAFPADWGPTLRRLADVDESRFVPGHGSAVDRDFVAAQALAFEQIAAACSEHGEPGAAAAYLDAHARAALGAQADPAIQRYFATLD